MTWIRTLALMLLVVTAGCNKQQQQIIINGPSPVPSPGPATPAPPPSPAPTQPGACKMRASPESRNVGYQEGSNSFGVVDAENCTLSPVATASWVHITQVVSCVGCSKGVAYTYDRNSNGVRSARIDLGKNGSYYTIYQEAAPPQAPPTVVVVVPPPPLPPPVVVPPLPPPLACPLTIAQAYSVPAVGGNTGISVLTPAGCSWTAVSNAGFSTIVGGSTGTGPSGVILVTTAQNPGPTGRTAVLTVIGSSETKTVTITQPGS